MITCYKWRMLNNGLEFAKGTTKDCQRLVQRLFDPADLLGAYKMARIQFKSGDLVLVVSEEDPSGFDARPRMEHIAKIRASMSPRNAAKMMPVLAIAHKSAHQIVSLPFESNAFWLVITRREALPIECVLYVTPYEVATSPAVIN